MERRLRGLLWAKERCVEVRAPKRRREEKGDACGAGPLFEVPMESQELPRILSQMSDGAEVLLRASQADDGEVVVEKRGVSRAPAWAPPVSWAELVLEEDGDDFL